MGFDGAKLHLHRKKKQTKQSLRERMQAPMLWFVVGVTCLGFFFTLATDKPATDQAVKTAQNAPGTTIEACTTKGGHLFATSKANLDRALSMLANKDTLALARMEQAGLAGILQPGVTVYQEDFSILSGMVEIRPKGATTTVWVSIDAVTCR